MIAGQFDATMSASAKYETGFGILSGLRKPPGRAKLCETQRVLVDCFQDPPTFAAYGAKVNVLNGGGSSRGKYPLLSSDRSVAIDSLYRSFEPAQRTFRSPRAASTRQHT